MFPILLGHGFVFMQIIILFYEENILYTNIALLLHVLFALCLYYVCFLYCALWFMQYKQVISLPDLLLDLTCALGG